MVWRWWDRLVGVTPRELFSAAGLAEVAAVPWGSPVLSASPGAYVVGVRDDADDPRGAGPLLLDLDALAGWLDESPGGVRLQGAPATVRSLADQVAQWWLPDEPVLYVGKATSLRARVGQYYSTPLGARRPHRGGYWIKMLDSPPALTVFYSATATAEAARRAEGLMLRHFGDCARLTGARLDAELTLPWANLEIVVDGRRWRRPHGIAY